MKFRTCLVPALGAITSLAGLASPASAVCVCGPGTDWINACAGGGTDSFANTQALLVLDTDLNDVPDRQIVLSGPSSVVRQAPGTASNNFLGQNGPHADTTKDVIDTELVSMTLTGGGITLRGGAGGAPALGQSKGAVIETAGNHTLADAFFDVLFEVDLGGGQKVYNQTPLRMAVITSCVPPDNSTRLVAQLGAPLPLFSAPSGGIEVARLVDAQHQLGPKINVPTVSTWGVAVMTILILAAATIVLRNRRMSVA